MAVELDMKVHEFKLISMKVLSLRPCSRFHGEVEGATHVFLCDFRPKIAKVRLKY